MTRDEQGNDLKTYDISELDRKTIRLVIEKLGFKNEKALEDLDKSSSEDEDFDDKPCPAEILEMSADL